MKNMYIKHKKAFTLSELLLVLMLISIISTCMLRILKSTNVNDKKFRLVPSKIISEFDIASSKIREIEKTKCPLGQFIVNAGGNWTYVLTTDGSTPMTSSKDAMDLYGEYIKLDYPASGYYNFCDYTDSSKISDCSSSITGARILGSAYVGIKVVGTAAGGTVDCPDFYRVVTETPDKTNKLPDNEYVTLANDIDLKTGVKRERKCWSKIYIDANGKSGPNVLGQDIFIYGIDGNGLVH